MAKTINGFPMADTDFYSLAAYLKNMLKQGDLSLNTIEAKQTNKCITFFSVSVKP